MGDEKKIAMESLGERLPMKKSPESVACGIVCALLGAWFGYSLWEERSYVWAILVIFGGIIIFWGLLKPRLGKCPRCGSVMGDREQLWGPVRCKVCPPSIYYRRDKKWLVPMTPGVVGEDAEFKVLISDLVTDRPWVLPWNGGCCVCGQGTENLDCISFHVVTGGLPGVFTHVKSYDVGIPTCNAHAGKGAKSGGGEVGFYSYDYWREFVRLNCR